MCGVPGLIPGEPLFFSNEAGYNEKVLGLITDQTVKVFQISGKDDTFHAFLTIVTGVAWYGWARDLGVMGPEFNSRGNPPFFGCQFQIR